MMHLPDFRVLPVFVALALCIGCGSSTHVDGRWTGVLRSVPMVVQNDKNQARNATAIEIMMGPRIPYPADDEYATERVAILLDHNHNIWDPAKIAVGKYVELTGRMTITTPLADHSPMTRSPEARPHMVLSIIPDGPPKVLNPE